MATIIKIYPVVFDIQKQMEILKTCDYMHPVEPDSPLFLDFKKCKNLVNPYRQIDIFNLRLGVGKISVFRWGGFIGDVSILISNFLCMLFLKKTNLEMKRQKI